jgi:hypothetical protein
MTTSADYGTAVDFQYTEPRAEERHRAARYVASRAVDADDARLLLEALGLLDGER